jgi:hypothetical protein
MQQVDVEPIPFLIAVGVVVLVLLRVWRWLRNR